MNSSNTTTLAPQQLLAQAQLIHSAEVVDVAIQKLGAAIFAALANTNPVVVCVMNGGLVFAGRLLTHLDFALQLDYMHASRYGNETVGQDISWYAMPRLPLVGRTVLLVDDILDEGITLSAIQARCHALGAKKVLTAVLVEKMLTKIKPIKADFVGLEVPNRYIFGMGMDVHGWWRNLPAIYAL